jgi:midasin (ATPase involved in ribosome maturation)
MAVDFKTFTEVAPLVALQGDKAGFPVLLRGRHGVGKSQVVYQTAAKLGLPVIERRASQMTEGDLVGLPSTDGNTTSFNPPDWFAQACSEPVALFLDEVDRATIEVRQGIFELTDSRKLNGHILHPRTVIFAAVNGGDHGAQYQVGEMDHSALVEKFGGSEVFKSALSETQVANLAGYFLTLPSEVAMKLWSVLGEGDVSNVTGLHQSVVDGKAVSAYIVELLTGKAPEDK